MPHVSNYLIDGVKAPSVNEITGSLSKDSLINHFWRKLGFQKADEITDISRNRGIASADAMETFRKTGRVPESPELLVFVNNWHTWQESTGYIVKPENVEAHLESKTYCFHGSPDGLGQMPGEAMELFDDKVKDKLADYKTLMNEAAYAQCWKEMTGETIKQFRIFTFHPKSGNLTTTVYVNEPQYFEDFLRCREMMFVNQRADAYYRANCKRMYK